MNKLLLSIGDLSTEEIRQILDRASALRSGAKLPTSTNSRGILGLAFFDESLRTRVGFQAAAQRLGLASVEVREVRGIGRSAEGWRDTIRTLCGYSDIVVIRAQRPLVHAEINDLAIVPILNGGDTGPHAEHPSQALIDAFAIDTYAGSIEAQSVAIQGELGTRAARSLLLLFQRLRPSRVVLITTESLARSLDIPAGMEDLCERREPGDLKDVDVLYVAGIPGNHATTADRAALHVDAAMVSSLPSSSIILSPMPLVDELAESMRSDPRLRMFEQSDAGVFVRMAILEKMLSE